MTLLKVLRMNDMSKFGPKKQNNELKVIRPVYRELLLQAKLFHMEVIKDPLIIKGALCGFREDILIRIEESSLIVFYA